MNKSPLFRIVSRCCAVWLVVLIAAPFTAPCRTWAPTEMADGAQGHERLGEGLSKDLAPPELSFVSTPTLSGVVLSLPQLFPDTSAQQVRLTVLRV